jgi:hypothetical protein
MRSDDDEVTMKRLLAAIFLLFASPLFAATWYATSSTVNINSASLWVPTSTGSCTGSGTALVWGAQGKNDVFDANGCTALAVNVDPGANFTTLTGTLTFTMNSSAVTGSSTLFTSQVAANDWIWLSGYGPVQVASVTNDTALVLTTPAAAPNGYPFPSGSGTAYDGIVTLQGNSAYGGAFTYASASGLTIHSNVIGNKATGLTISGSSGTTTFIGNITAAGTTGYITGVLDTRTGGTLNLYGQIISCPTCNGTPGYSITSSTGSPVQSLTGNCVGSGQAGSPGCAASYEPLTLTGSLINGEESEAEHGYILFRPCSTCYILFPKDSSYTLGLINTHSIVMPTDPGVANVLTGTKYGPFTGTLSAGSVSASASW